MHPRLWAEEGVYYYSSLQTDSFIAPMSLIVRGNFQLLTNWIAYLATIVPAIYAAYITTYCALLVLVIFIRLVGLLAVQRNWSPLLSVVIVANLALLPQGYEIYLTATNVQWVCSVSVLLIFILDVENLTIFHKKCFYFLVLISGFTGVCSVMLAPMLLLRGYLSNSRFHFNVGLILAGCAAFHIFIILGNLHQDRVFPTDIFTLTFPLILQSIFSPLIGAGVVDQGLALLNKVERAWVYFILVYLISLCLAAFTVISARSSIKDKQLALMIFVAWIYISILNVIGSIGDPSGLISGWGGGRYFYLGAVCFIILLGFVASSNSLIKSKIAYALLLLMADSGTKCNTG